MGAVQSWFLINHITVQHLLILQAVVNILLRYRKIPTRVDFYISMYFNFLKTKPVSFTLFHMRLLEYARSAIPVAYSQLSPLYHRSLYTAAF